MVDGRGGYQPPANPAPVSGPGKMSQRTDRGQPVRALTDAAYGEQATYQADQQGAPMAASGSAAPSGGGMPQADTSRVIPFGDSSQRPGEPITSGAATGAGPGMSALGVADPSQAPIRQYMADALPMLEIAGSLPFADVQFRQFVRRLRANN